MRANTMEEDLDLLPAKPYLLTDEDWEVVNSRRRRQVIRIASAQWWLCYYCDLPIDEHSVSRDHRIPRSKGGRGLTSNIVATCVGCNQRKGNDAEPPERYIRMKQRQYYRGLGLVSMKQRQHWATVFPGFGTDLEGERLFAPQFGIV